MPFDIYSTHHSCGPVPFTCDNFDFERRSPNINRTNIESNANQLVQQYSKTASLFPHNVALVLLGGDFTYSRDAEFDQQYSGYKKLIDYVNLHSKTKYNGATLQFGTPHDYFNEIKKRQGHNFPSLVGDFFPYSDIFSSGVPAYWTGYFTTRPYYKFMSRKLEHNLRNAEILFTIALNTARQQSKINEIFFKRMEKDYEKIVEARRNLGLFQHHDAITGTSKLKVMTDYLNRLKKSINDVIKIHEATIKFLLKTDESNFVIINIDHPDTDKKMIIDIKTGDEKKIVLFNSLAQDRFEMVPILANDPHVIVKDNENNEMKYQINVVFDSTKNFEISSEVFEVNILVKIPAMSLISLHLSHDQQKNIDKCVKITCRKCLYNEFFNTSELSGSIEIENSEVKLIFNELTGFLKSLKHAEYDDLTKLEINFGGYKSGMSTSGSYLFKPDMMHPEHNNIFIEQPETKIYVSKGELSSDVTVIRGPLLLHTIRIFHTQTYLDNAIALDNIIDFEGKDKNKDVEMFIRINTNIENDKNDKNETEFFTDLNGFQWQPRRKTKKLNIEGNYYPITSSIFIQDEIARISLLTTHAQGATSFKKGEIEVMLDRRILYDDGRGMGEGVLDSVKMNHKFWLILEFFPGSMEIKEVEDVKKYQTLSLFANHMSNTLNYPINSYSLETTAKITDIKLFDSRLPCDTHVINLRSLTDNILDWLPSHSALFILYRYGYDCQLTNDLFMKDVCELDSNFDDLQYLKNLKVDKVEKTLLTGLNDGEKIESFSDDSLELMEIRTYKVSFS
ncbi:hypothetical protein PVAND_012029 [Polypedilum vanderplanki]|uniref:Alpha-mannosidase n=1 Tax=Polypedilum vanderplanki TaxID=319348 RepID=A0A9J6CM63_POLVA|nr:hypothetical protein PVAND_012029 [Polypedilum vanderplanki]